MQLSTWELHGIPPVQTFLPSPTFISTPPIDVTSNLAEEAISEELADQGVVEVCRL
jgi:hypothetical protein